MANPYQNYEKYENDLVVDVCRPYSSGSSTEETQQDDKVSFRSRISLMLLVFINLLNYMDRFTISGEKEIHLLNENFPLTRFCPTADDLGHIKGSKNIFLSIQSHCIHNVLGFIILFMIALLVGWEFVVKKKDHNAFVYQLV